MDCWSELIFERDVMHVHTGSVGGLVHQLAYGSPLLVLCCFAFFYGLNAAFAVAFWFLDESCFKLEDGDGMTSGLHCGSRYTSSPR